MGAANRGPQGAVSLHRARTVGPRRFRRAARGACTLATLARDHLALLDALGIDEFVLVGLSIGGMWGVELARMAPARLKGLVLMDSFVGLEPQITCERYLGMLAMIEQLGTIPAPSSSRWRRCSLPTSRMPT